MKSVQSNMMLVGRKFFEIGNFFFLIFSANISTLDESLDIFAEFFDPRYARAEKFAKNVSTFVLCRNIYRKNLEKKNCPLQKNFLPLSVKTHT